MLSRRGAQREGGGDDSIIMMLSLKLLLLAFFILLVVLSDFEERRTKAVIESLNQTFRGQVPALRNLPIPEAALGQLDTSRTMVDEVAELFEESLPLVEPSSYDNGRRLRLELPTSALFRGDGTEILHARQPLLQRLAEVLAEDDRRFDGASAFELQLIQSVEAEPGEMNVDSLPIARAGVFARQMSDYGVEDRRMAVTLSAAMPAGRLALEIRLYDEERPEPDLGVSARDEPAGEQP